MTTAQSEFESLDLAWARLMPPAERRRIRESAGVSLTGIARDLRCTTTAVAQWELGQRSPTGHLGAAYGRLLRQLGALVEDMSAPGASQ